MARAAMSQWANGNGHQQSVLSPGNISTVDAPRQRANDRWCDDVRSCPTTVPVSDGGGVQYGDAVRSAELIPATAVVRRGR